MRGVARGGRGRMSGEDGGGGGWRCEGGVAERLRDEEKRF